MNKISAITIALLLMTRPTVQFASETRPAETQPVSKEQTLLDDRISQLVAKIGDNVNPFHPGLTPAVIELIKTGKPALPAVLPLMLDKNAFTREHAACVVGNVSAMMHGWRPGGLGWATKNGSADYERFLHEHGDLDPDGSEESRRRAVGLWKEWLSSGAKVKISED